MVDAKRARSWKRRLQPSDDLNHPRLPPTRPRPCRQQAGARHRREEQLDRGAVHEVTRAALGRGELQRPRRGETVTYDEFKHAWILARQESGLPLLSAYEGDETLDPRSLSRTFETFVEPLGGQEAEPFHVAAALSWRWDALATARTVTTEEDMLTEVLGRERVWGHKPRTERSPLRVDVSLRASLPYGKAIPMPSSPTWAKWAREAHGRLERIEPLVPEKTTREGRDGRLEILAWQGDPVAKVICGVDGDLKLESVEIAAGQVIELPRRWDDTDRKPDEHPAVQLHELFARVRAALHAWMQAADHLRPRDEW